MTVGLTMATVDALLPPPKTRTFTDCCDSVSNHKGEPFNPIDFPWTEYICDTWDDPNVRSITLQMCARIGKTQLSQSIMVATIGRDPSTFMYGNASETIVKDTVREKWYPMFKNCILTRKWVPPKSRQIQTRINLTNCQGYTSWSGSATQLADKDPKYKLADEVDKWDKSKSDEADSLPLFLERGLEIPDGKTLIGSTPQITKRSRVEYHLLKGSNCRWQVPCPKCEKFQELVFGDGIHKGGIVFAKKDGKLDENTARLTATYQCKFCSHKITEDERKPMIKKGVWCPEGQRVTKKGKVIGTRTNPGPHESFQLARWYAPTFSFGECAAAFVAHYKKGQLQNWNNSWMGVTWQPVLSDDPWEDVAERMDGGYELHHVPVGGYFLTCAVDVQVDHFVFMVIAWGKGQQGWIVDYGTCNTWQDVTEQLETKYQHDDGGPDIGISMTLIDAKDGNRMDEVVDYCRSVNSDSGPFVWPCHGAKAGSMAMMPYRRNVLDDDNRKGKAAKRQSTAFCIVTVNTNYWQQWIHNCLYHRKIGQDRSLAVPTSAASDQDLFDQFMNELPDTKTDATNHASFVWVKVFLDIPVDFRDCVRYNRCAAEAFVRSNWARVAERRRLSFTPKVPDDKVSDSVSTKPTGKRPAKNPERSWIRKVGRARFGKRKNDSHRR